MITDSRILPVLRCNLTLFSRDPGPIIGRIIQPVLLILLLRPLYVAATGSTDRGTFQVVAGHLVLFTLLGMSIVGTAILTERRWATFDRLCATPARPIELLVGKAIPILAFLLVQQALVLALGILVVGLNVANYLLLLVATTAWAITVLCLGAAIAMYVRSYAQLSAIIDISATIMAALGGGLVPFAALPGWAQTIAPIWPSHWAMQAISGAVHDQPSQALPAVAMLIAIAILGAIVAARRLSRGWGRTPIL